MSKNSAEVKHNQAGYVFLDGNGTTHSTPESPHSKESPTAADSLTPTIMSLPNSTAPSPMKIEKGATPPAINLPPPSSGNVSPVTPPEVELKSVSDKINAEAIPALLAKHEEELKLQRDSINQQYEKRLAEQHRQHIENVKAAIAKITSDLESKHASELSAQKKIYEEQILKMQAEISKRDAEVQSHDKARIEMKAAMGDEKVWHEATQAALVTEKEEHSKTRNALEHALAIIANHPVALRNACDTAYNSGRRDGISAEKDRMNGPDHL